MRKHLFLTLVAVIFSFVKANGQDSGIRGVVTEASGETVPGAIVKAISGNEEKSTITDENGKFILSLNPGNWELSANSSGMKEYRMTLSVEVGKFLEIGFSLESSDTELGTVVISAGKFEQKIEEITVSMEVIKPYLIENKVCNNVSSILEQVPGMNIVDGQISIRGGGGFSYGAGSRVLVMIDGLPMLTADAGDVRWAALAVENIEQVEVLKGASSALFGSSAMNGVINIRTKYPRSKPSTYIEVFNGVYSPHVRRDSTGSRRDSNGKLNQPMRWWGSQNPIYNGINLSHSRIVGKNLDVVVGGQAYSDNAYRLGEAEQRLRANTNLRYRIAAVPGLSVGLNANVAWRKGGNFFLWENSDSGALKPRGGLDPKTTTITFFNTVFTTIDPYISYVRAKDRHDIKYRLYSTQNENTNDQSTSGQMHYTEYQYHRNITEDHLITAGMVYIGNVVKAELFGNHQSKNAAGYVQYDGTFFKKLKFSLGIRGEYFEMDDTLVNQNVLKFGNAQLNTNVRPVIRTGFNYHLFKFTWLRGSFGQGYRFPSVAERYINTNVGPLRLFPNAELRPERGWSAEGAIRQAFGIGSFKGYADLAAFYTQYFDMIEFVYGTWGNTGPFFQRIGFKALNVEDAIVKGVELSVGGTGKINDFDISIIGGYTYMDPRIVKADSAFMANVSNPDSDMLKYRFKHLVKFDGQVEWKRFMAGFSIRANSFMENADRVLEEELFLPGSKAYRAENKGAITVFDVRVSYKITEQCRLAIVSNNLFNVEYMGRPGDIRPPRTTAVQCVVKF